MVVDSPYDLPTIYLSSWVEKLVGEARLLGIPVLSLRGSISEADLVNAIQSFQPEIIILAGHGSSDTFTTANLAPLIVACQNDQILSGRNVCFFSCLSGQQLVPSTVSKKAVGASGFTSEFAWVVAPPYLPEGDPYAKPFERLFVEPMLEVLSGRGWQGWYNRFQQVALEEERNWIRSSDPLAKQVVLFLGQNRRAATWFGEGGGAGGGGLIPLIVAGLVLFKGKLPF